MPSAFITGVTGQDGSYLAERLHADGWEVHALVRAVTIPDESPYPAWVLPHPGDLEQPDSLGPAVHAAAPDAVFHLAGATSVAESWTDPERVARVTGSAVAALLDAAYREQESAGRRVAFVQASSAEIFGAAAESPQNEDTPVRPTNPYGAAKAFAHHLVGVYRARGLAASSAILYNHESPRRPPRFVTRKITREVARIALGRSDRLVLGNVDARRDWGWAPDYVDAMLRMSAPGAEDDYVVGTGVAHSVRDFVNAAFTAAGVDPEGRVSVDEGLLRPTDAAVLLADPARIRDRLRWAPTRGFADIVAAMVQADLAAEAAT